ncbi:MAG: DUF3349 domain-containing protein [Mycobacterium sp.]
MTDSESKAADRGVGSPGFLQSFLGWLHQVYPNGIPRTDYFPLLALLKRTLTEDEVVQAAFSVLKDSDPDDPVTGDQIRDAIRETAEKEPTREEINQVAARLAMVGWPLADHG